LDYFRYQTFGVLYSKTKYPAVVGFKDQYPGEEVETSKMFSGDAEH